MLKVQQTGVPVDRRIGDSIAAKNGCAFLSGENLKPINFVSSELEITDGTIRGWASPYLYILYVNRK